MILYVLVVVIIIVQLILYYKKFNKYIILLVSLIIIILFLKTSKNDEYVERFMEVINFIPLPYNIRQLIQFASKYLLANTKTDKVFKGHKRNVSQLQKKMVASSQQWKCNKCRIILNFDYEIDHIKPLFKNGTNELSNLQALCRNCHGIKTGKDLL